MKQIIRFGFSVLNKCHLLVKQHLSKLVIFLLEKFVGRHQFYGEKYKSTMTPKLSKIESSYL